MNTITVIIKFYSTYTVSFPKMLYSKLHTIITTRVQQVSLEQVSPAQIFKPAKFLLWHAVTIAWCWAPSWDKSMPSWCVCSSGRRYFILFFLKLCHAVWISEPTKGTGFTTPPLKISQGRQRLEITLTEVGRGGCTPADVALTRTSGVDITQRCPVPHQVTRAQHRLRRGCESLGDKAARADHRWDATSRWLVAGEAPQSLVCQRQPKEKLPSLVSVKE